MPILRRSLNVLLASVVFLGCKHKMEKSSIFEDDDGRIHFRKGSENLVVAPSSVNEARAAALLPMKPSEDMSHLLRAIDLPKSEPKSDSDREYLPYDTVEWVVTAEFSGSPRLNPNEVFEAFEKKWRDEVGGHSVYGRDADTGLWTFLISADGPKAVTSLKFAWDYVGLNDDSPVTLKLLEKRLVGVTERLKRFGDAKVNCSLPPNQAERRARELRDLKARFDQSAVLILKAPKGRQFDGNEIWDVMLCLGLKWGDMDCFHWANQSEFGDDQFFSVETTTPPGYFLPEEIAAGRLHTNDLVFVFSIPRSTSPVAVFDAMETAAAYCQRRLKGTIHDQTGHVADFAAIRSRIEGIDREMRKIGIDCGSDAALRLF